MGSSRQSLVKPIAKASSVPAVSARSQSIQTRPFALPHDDEYSSESHVGQASQTIKSQLMTIPVHAAETQTGPQSSSHLHQEEEKSGNNTRSLLGTDMFTVEDGHPNLSGNVNGYPIDSEQIIITAPHVLTNANVELKPNIILGSNESIQLGPVQTLLSSERVGVYRQGGKPDGKIVSEHHCSVGTIRDAMWKDGESDPEPIVEDPWYSQFSEISNTVRKASVNLNDRPSFTIPRSLSNGILTETYGQDRFITSITAQQENQLVPLVSTHWEIPWAMAINEQSSDLGSEIIAKSTSEDPSTTTPSTANGKIAVAAAKEWITFPTLESAMKGDINVLMQNLATLKSEDSDSWLNCVEALRQRNPKFNIVLVVKETSGWFGKDEIEFSAAGDSRRQLEKITLSQGESKRMSFSLSSLFDPINLDASTELVFNAKHVGWLSDNTARAEWPYPFTSQKDPVKMKDGDGDYYISGRLT